MRFDVSFTSLVLSRKLKVNDNEQSCVRSSKEVSGFCVSDSAEQCIHPRIANDKTSARQFADCTFSVLMFQQWTNIDVVVSARASVAGWFVRLQGLPERSRYYLHWCWHSNKLDQKILDPKHSSDMFIIQCNLSPSYSKNLAHNIFPTATPKACWVVLSIYHRRFSMISPREFLWMQSMDVSDFFPQSKLPTLPEEFSYRDIIRFSGNSFQQRCASQFLVSVLLLNRLQHLGDRFECDTETDTRDAA